MIFFLNVTNPNTTQVMKTFKNLYYDNTQKPTMWKKTKSQIVTKLKHPKQNWKAKGNVLRAGFCDLAIYIRFYFTARVG